MPLRGHKVQGRSVSQDPPQSPPVPSTLTFAESKTLLSSVNFRIFITGFQTQKLVLSIQFLLALSSMDLHPRGMIPPQLQAPPLHEWFAPYPVRNPRQFSRLQRDLGLPRNTEDMFTALQRRLVEKSSLETIHEWLNRPTGRYDRGIRLGNDAPFPKRRPGDKELSFNARHFKIKFRYALRRTKQRRDLSNKEILSKDPFYELGPDGELRLKGSFPHVSRDRRSKPEDSWPHLRSKVPDHDTTNTRTHNDSEDIVQGLEPSTIHSGSHNTPEDLSMGGLESRCETSCQDGEGKP